METEEELRARQQQPETELEKHIRWVTRTCNIVARLEQENAALREKLESAERVRDQAIECAGLICEEDEIDAMKAHAIEDTYPTLAAHLLELTYSKPKEETDGKD